MIKEGSKTCFLEKDREYVISIRMETNGHTMPIPLKISFYKDIHGNNELTVKEIPHRLCNRTISYDKRSE